MFGFWKNPPDEVSDKQDIKDLIDKPYSKWEKAYLWVKDGDAITKKEDIIICAESIYSAFLYYDAFKSDMFLYEVEALFGWLHDLWRFNGKCAKKVKNPRKLNWDEFKNILFECYSSIESKSDFKKARKLGYKDFAFLKYCAIVTESGETEDFARITYKPGKEQIEKFKLLSRENVSRDNMIYLLTK